VNIFKIAYFTAVCAAYVQAFAAEPAAPLPLKISDKLRAEWDNSRIQEQIESGIRANRMGSFKLEFSAPVSDVEAKLVRHDFLFGCNAFMADGIRNEDGSVNADATEKYGSAFAKIFNYATIAFYAADLEPEQGKYRFSKDSPYIFRRPPVDASLEFCGKYNLTPKGHCLVWVMASKYGTPAWVGEKRDRHFSRETTLKRIRDVAAAYGDKIKYWDVVNEATSTNYSRINRDCFIFDDYVNESFKEAQKVFPEDCVLINNDDTSVWYEADKYDEVNKFFIMNRYLLAAGRKLDASGIQYHIFKDKEWADVLSGQIQTPAFFTKTLDVMARLNRPVHITEITIPTKGPDGEELQAYWVERIYKLWFSHPAVEAITWWNLADGTATGAQDNINGGLLRKDFTPKKSYEALDRLINTDWTTCEKFEGKNRVVNFRGFYGTYKITYVKDGKPETTTVRFSKGDCQKVIVLK